MTKPEYQHRIGMALQSLHSALSELHTLQAIRPDLVARDQGDLETAHDSLTVLIQRIGTKQAAE